MYLTFYLEFEFFYDSTCSLLFFDSSYIFLLLSFPVIINFMSVIGKVKKVLFEGRVLHAKEFKYEKDADFINGLPSYYLDLKQNFDPKDSKMVDVTTAESGETVHISFKEFTPGSVIAFQ